MAQAPAPTLVSPRRSRGQRPLLQAGLCPGGPAPPISLAFGGGGGGQVPSSGLRPGVLSPDPFPDGPRRVTPICLRRFIFSWGHGPRTGAASQDRAAPAGWRPRVQNPPSSWKHLQFLHHWETPCPLPPPLMGGVGEGNEQVTRGLLPPTKLEDGLRRPKDPPRDV